MNENSENVYTVQSGGPTALNERYPGQLRLFGHSQGNIVAAQALKTAPANLVQVYISMQGAIAAHDYDATTASRNIQWGDAGTPDVHANYFGVGVPYLNGVKGAASSINFYNPVDWALAAWEIDQDLKPDGSLAYSYNSGQFKRASQTLVLPDNTFEIFSYCVESRCFALGQQAGVAGAFLPAQEELLDPTYSFGDHHKGHSAEFLSNNAARWLFWRRVMEQFGLRSNP